MASFVSGDVLECLTVNFKLAGLPHTVEDGLGPNFREEEAREDHFGGQYLPCLNESIPVPFSLIIQSVYVSESTLLEIRLRFEGVWKVGTELSASSTAYFIMPAFIICNRSQHFLCRIFQIELCSSDSAETEGA